MFNQFSFGTVIIGAWLVFFAVWLISAFWAKPDVKGQPGRTWMFFWLWRILIVIFLVFVISRGGSENSAIDSTLFHVNNIIGWIAAVLTVAGIGIAVWARYYLGRNWSSHPTHKEHHDLITGGPYTWIRHPIYTGILLALVGCMIVGSPISFIMFIVLLFVFIVRVGKEEHIMLGLFPDQYPAYQARTKKLIPFIW
jgi:protein-S-isoprenylcysteine O-methyltransferase Ste14